ncbi:hypothetical protein [Streptomyces sp. NPDC050988]
MPGAGARQEFRPPGSDYYQVLAPAARKAVEEVYAAEFDRHGYIW